MLLPSLLVAATQILSVSVCQELRGFTAVRTLSFLYALLKVAELKERGEDRYLQETQTS